MAIPDNPVPIWYSMYALLGTKKLNTTSYHPQCGGMVERFNRTLKTMLGKHASNFGTN